MTQHETLAETVRWRGSTYNMESVEDGVVTWVNPTSRHRDKCSAEAWNRSDPYDGRLS